MRALTYVKFLDEIHKLPRLDDIKVPDIWNAIKSDLKLVERYENFRASFSVYNDTLKNVGFVWDTSPDNHSHSLALGNINRSANSISLENLFFDMEVVKRLDDKRVELITNSFSQRWLEEPNNPILKAQMAEKLVIDYVPNYLSREGPYHPCVDEARENPFLRDFRKWIINQPVHTSEKELLEIKESVETAIRQSQDEIFLKYLDPKSHYKSVGKTIFGAGVDLLIPYASTVASVAEEVKAFFDHGNRRWQGFIVSMRQKKNGGGNFS